MAARSGRQYPRTFGEFLNWFPDDPACALYLAELRWPEGFSCPRCGASTGEPTKAWSTSRGTYVCARCKKETSLITGTIFEGTRVRLVTWFRAAWLVCSSKSGVSAKHLQRELGISYPTAWMMLHKLRLAMKRPGRDADRLRGEIEVDESYLGGPTPGGKRGRGAEGKLIVAIAVERMEPTDDEQRLLGRARIQVIPDVKAKTLLDFVEDTCEPGSIIRTDGLAGYRNLPSRGYEHHPLAVAKGNDPAHVSLPGVHRVASLLKRWLLGTHHGGWAAQHAEAYLDEFVFRFNRRGAGGKSGARGLLFYRLLSNAVVMRKLDYETLVLSRRGQRGARRGPEPKPRRERAPRGRAAMKQGAKEMLL